MQFTMRPYRGEDDFWKIRNFLRDVMIANGLREYSWHIARLDYWRWHVADAVGMTTIDDVIFIWEAPDGHIAAVLNPEAPGEAHFQVHPHYNSPELAADMLAAAEANLMHEGRLVVFADSADTQRMDLLQARGYTRGEWPEHQWRHDFDIPVPDVPAPAGFTLRALGGAEELPARSWCSWRAFHPDDPDDKYQGHDWYARNIQREPLYRRDLDIIAVPEGESFVVAAFTTIWYDDVTRTAYFEPVGTAPEYQRRGLGRALLMEGLRRLQHLGCKRAFVGGYSEAANGLYRAVFSDDHDLSVPWIKEA